MNYPKDLAQHKKILDIIEGHKNEAAALLPILHAIQEHLGYIPEETLAQIAHALNLSRAEVYGVVTYYHYFRLTPPAKHVIQVCRAEACQSRGANALLSHIEARLGCQLHGTSHDGNVTLEPIYCLGQCATGPAILVDETELYARVDNATFDALIQDLGEGKGQ
jgi:formate dehydrogenase subunit gamma